LQLCALAMQDASLYTPPMPPYGHKNHKQPCLPPPSQQGQFRHRSMRHEIE